MPTESDAKVPIPFSIADIFDYLIPGATLLAAGTLYDYRLNQWLGVGFTAVTTPFFELFSTVTRPVVRHEDAVLSLLLVTGLAIGAYVTGHVVSSFSSLFIDRVLIFKGHGYPYRSLLKLHRKKFDRKGPHTYHGAFYRGVFFWSNIALLSVYSWAAFGGWTLKVNAAFWCSGVLGSILAKLVVSNNGWRKPGTYVYGLRARLITKRRIMGMARRSSQKKRGVVGWLLNVVNMNWAWRIYSSPYDMLARLYASYTNSQGALEPQIREAYTTHFREQFGCNPEDLASSNYWLTSCFVIRRSPEFARMTFNWLRLYEFARNLSTAFYLAFVYCVIIQITHRSGLRPIGDKALFVGPLVLFGLSFLMLGRYYYLYVCYLSKFVFRAFIYLNRENERRGHVVETKPFEEPH